MSDKYQNIIKDLDPSLKMLLDKIKRFLSAGKASVMIGSGFSMNAENDGTGQMRTWNALNEDLYRSLYGKDPTKEELDKSNPVRLAAQVESAHGLKELDEIIMYALPDKSVYPGTLHKKLMRLHWRDVFTTNYDTLLERSSEDSGTAYTLVTNKETLLYSKSPRIIKLHGSFPDVRPFIMSEESFRTYPQKYPEFVNTVRQSLIENLFCLIGFSGNDPNFLSWQGWIRDVMGDQMTNAILVDYKKEGIHISEKQLFASRKIDILNLAEIKELETYKDALDFFLTYIGMQEKKSTWSYPSIDPIFTRFGEKKEDNFEADIKKMSDARKSYPGWVFMKETDLIGSGISCFPFKYEYYNKLPDELKIKYLFELDWLLDVSLYPRTADWYIVALQSVKDNFAMLKGENKDMACQLIISLFNIYRETRQIDEYLTTLEFVEKNCLDILSTKQKSIFYYEQCQWNLSILDYKDVYAILLKWKILDNDFIGALWQASVYRELGDYGIAEELILSYYSRLTTRMLLDDNSAFLSSCKQLYSFVISRTIRKSSLEIEVIEDNVLDGIKKKFVKEALKEQPRKTQTHGFNIGQVTDTTHMHQGGFVAEYLYPEQYLRLCYLHGSTIYQGNASDSTDYIAMLGLVSKYHFYEAVARLVRSGNANAAEQIVNREAISRVGKDDIFIMFTDLFEMVKENIEDSNKRKRFVATNLLILILQRLCTKVDDASLYEFFEFVIKYSSITQIKRNNILKTIYACATEEQKGVMLQKVMEHPIALDDNHNDILIPECRATIEVSDTIFEECTKHLSKKHHTKQSYSRILTLLNCNIDGDSKRKLEDAIVAWRKSEEREVNAFFSYHVVPARDDADKAIETKWHRETIATFLRQDFSDTKTSETIMNFSHFVDSIVPALESASAEETERVVEKITETLYYFREQLMRDDRDELFGGFRHFSSHMFDVLERVFGQCKFNVVEQGVRDSLIRILLDCYGAKHPCLYMLCIVDNVTDKHEYAKSATNRQFDKEPQCRQDARRCLWYLFKTYPEDFRPSKVFGYVRHISYFMEYSHSTTLKEHIRFIADLVSDNLLDAEGADFFVPSLLTISNDLRDYEMVYDYKIDIAYNACVLAGAISTKIEGPRAGLHAWKEISEDPEEFREIRNGFANGVRMCEMRIDK